MVHRRRKPSRDFHPRHMGEGLKCREEDHEDMGVDGRWGSSWRRGRRRPSLTRMSMYNTRSTQENRKSDEVSGIIVIIFGAAIVVQYFTLGKLKEQRQQ